MHGIGRDTLVDGRYRILSRIGSGGMGDVYCATDSELERKVAIKLLHRRFAEDVEFVERFKREASSAAGLSHPNIVQVFDRGEWDGTYYIAMELLAGRTLKQLVREHGALDPGTAVDLVKQVLEAERFAHQRRVVHRDIKPHNVIVDDEGRAKVTDFGIARAGASDMTETGSIMGTAQYLSPEQAQGRPVDARSDLYSTGVLLYELVTGTVPFDAESPVTIALKQVSELPVPPIQRNPAVPPTLNAVILRALEKDPAARFQSADEFLAALEQSRRGVAVTTYAASEDPVALVEEDERRSRGAIAAIAVVVLLLAGLGAWLLLRGDKETVPNVVGKSSASAAQLLQNRGFEVDVIPIRSDSVPDGRVAGQRPEPGEQADKGSTVSITVSSGPGETTVPTVQGLPADDAAARLSDAGFKVERRRRYSSSVQSGRVIRTSPPEGSTVERGRTVTLVVSRGRRPVAVPAVVGRDRAAAETALRNAGFDVAVSEQEDDQVDPGTVLRQDPGGGAQAPTGSTVKLVVAKAPPPVQVPDVRGQPEDAARSALEDAGFKVRSEDEPVTAADQDGLVQRQDPAGGGQAQQGERVTIFVGRLESTPTPTPTPTPVP